MNRIEELVDSNHVLNSLAKCSTTGDLRKSASNHADIKGLHLVFEKLKKTPDMIRLLLQHEFQFEGVVNAYAPNVNQEQLLRADWYQSTFVIPHYSSVKKWAQKCIAERNKGKTVVCLIPSRTNTEWFHTLVIQEAYQIRFIRGRITMPGFNTQSPYPDAICVYRPKTESSRSEASGSESNDESNEPNEVSSKSKRRRSEVIKCTTSFTSDETEFRVRPDDSDNEDGMEEED